MQKVSSQNYQKQYEEEGYAVFRNVLDKSALNSINRHLETLRQQKTNFLNSNVITVTVKDDLFGAKIVAEERLLNIAEQFIGANIALFWVNYVVKWAHDAKPVLWHQDASNWQLEPLEAVSLSIAIDDSTTENGCLRVIPGSHKLGLHKLRRAENPPSIFGWQTDPVLVCEEKAVDIVLRAGDVSVHHPLVIHGSNANYSSKRRAALIVRYIPANVKVANGASWFKPLILRAFKVEK